jgi:hypothetical protein
MDYLFFIHALEAITRSVSILDIFVWVLSWITPVTYSCDLIVKPLTALFDLGR